MKVFLFSLCVCANFFIIFSQDFSLNIESDIIENVISDKFISFSINPDVLLQENCSTTRNEWICMAKSLSPSYIRIEEFPILNLITDKDDMKSEKEMSDNINPFMQITEIKMLNNFINWTKNANTVPVIKLNSSERLANGKWNSISAIKMFSMAYKFQLKECVWQLNIDCEKQNLSTYIDDLKSLKIIVDSFLFGRDIDWKIISGDLSNCFNENYHENWSDFIKKSESIVDAIDYDYVSDISLLNINLSDMKNMKYNMVNRNIQLWKNYDAVSTSEEGNYFDWLKTLGNSAVEGFTVVVKKLTEEDIIQPSLSYYVSLLHKKFVGPEVLKVKFNGENLRNLSAYAHCAILPSGRVQDGVTLFAINENDEERNLTLKFSVKENGGSIMQFILQKYDNEIFLNEEKMTSEGDLKPMIIEALPEKPLQINIPPRAIGFWIVTNTNIRACSNQNDKTVLFRNMLHKQLQPDHMTEVLKNLLLLSQDSKTSFKSKRSIENDEENIGKDTITGFELPVSEADSDFFEEISKFTISLPTSKNNEDFFDTLGRLKIMLDLEKQLIEIGNSFLQLNKTLKNSTELENETVSNNSQILHERFVRSADDIEITNESLDEEIANESPNEEVNESLNNNQDEEIIIIENKNKTENDKLMSSKIIMPKTQKVHLEKSIESLDEIIEKAKQLLKTMNETTKNEEAEEIFESSNEKAPLVALPGIDPELQLKTELLKNKIKLNEIKNKIKARIATLKTKLKLALPHKILKRNAEDNSIDNELYTAVEDDNIVEMSRANDFGKIYSIDFLNSKDDHLNISKDIGTENDASNSYKISNESIDGKFLESSTELARLKLNKINSVLEKPHNNSNPIFHEIYHNATESSDKILEINVTDEISIEDLDPTEDNDGIRNFLKTLSDFYENVKIKLEKVWKIAVE